MDVQSAQASPYDGNGRLCSERSCGGPAIQAHSLQSRVSELGAAMKNKPGSETNREITDSEIAAAAYERYLARGGEDGHDVEDWLSAEESLRQNRPPARRMGGQEIPDELQDRPEQNAGYDAAVRGAGPAEDVNWDGDSDQNVVETIADQNRPKSSQDR